MIDTTIAIRNYSADDQPWFESLNRSWIEEHFEMEPLDWAVLRDPDHEILAKGGHILMAMFDQQIIGTVALKQISATMFEMTKMAVDESFRHKGVGSTLAKAAIGKARLSGAKTLVLYSNRKLAPAIALYRKLGFAEVPVDAIYKRGDIKMKLEL